MATYEICWRNKFLTTDATSIEEMAQRLEGGAQELRRMAKAGIVLDPDGGTMDDYAQLVTSDPKAAKRFNMQEREGD